MVIEREGANLPGRYSGSRLHQCDCIAFPAEAALTFPPRSQALCAFSFRDTLKFDNGKYII